MTEIRILRPADQPRLEDYLRPRLDSSLFLVGNSRRAGLVDRGRTFEGTYFAAFDGGRITGVVAHYWLKNLIFQSPPELVEPMLEAVTAAAVRPVEGLLGPAAQVAKASEALRLSAERIQFDEQEGLYSLKLEGMAVPEAVASGRFRGRRIERRDLDLVSAWRRAYSLEALNADDTPELAEKCRADMEAALERGDSWVLEDGGAVVASTSFGAVIDEAVQVGGVWTPPELRGRGYGRAVVAVSLLDARAESVERSILFTGDGNVAAIKAYRALGYRRIGDYRVVLLREAIAPCTTSPSDTPPGGG